MELDGDEQTRVIWDMIKKQLILPFLDIDIKYYDLGMEYRDKTNDQVTIDAAHAIQKYNREEKKLAVTCDNCVGQNKNNYSLFFYSWLIDRGTYDEVELNFMIPGHTKFICDSCFGLIKILYRKSKVNTVDDVVSVINRSTTVHLNTAQRYLNG